MATLVVGVKNVHIAVQTADVQAGATTYDTPVRLEGVTDSIDISDSVNQAIYYGDDQAAASTQAKGAIEITISKQNLSDAQEALILGKSIVGGFVNDTVSDNPPYLATMYELTLDDGGAKFVQIDKVRFQENTQGGATKSDNVEYQSMELVGQGISRLSDGRRKRSKLVTAANVVAERAAFFGNANDAAVSALTLTTSPADAATGVLVGANLVLTYNNSMQAATFDASNIQLIKATDGVEVALTWTTSNQTVWTGTHAALSAASAYILVISDNVRDVFGQGIQRIVNFTTA